MAARPGRRASTVVAILLPLLLVAAAGGVRFARLSEPPSIYFDETYYVEDARAVAEQGIVDGFTVHPPLGRWLIASSMAVFGDHPFGWRAASAAAGSLTVLGVYLAGLRLFRRRGAAALAAVLLAVDGLAFTMSRIAMLEAFLTLFVVAGFWLLLVDRDRQWASTAEPSPRPLSSAEPSPLPEPRALRRPHRWLAGIAFGLALATKWSAVLALGAAGLFVLGSGLAWQRRMTGSVRTGWWRLASGVVLSLVAVPAVVYLASYGSWLANHPAPAERGCATQGCALAALADAWTDEHVAIAGYHLSLTADHAYRSRATTWPTLQRPVAYYYEACTAEQATEDGCQLAPGKVVHVLGVGNPVLWWLALPAYPLLLWLGAKHRDWRAWALITFLAVQYLPWLAVQRPLFLYYMTPLVPFMAIGVVLGADHVGGRLGRWLPLAVAVLAVAGFAFLYPVLAGSAVSHEAWQLRMLLDSWI